MQPPNSRWPKQGVYAYASPRRPHDTTRAGTGGQRTRIYRHIQVVGRALAGAQRLATYSRKAVKGSELDMSGVAKAIRWKRRHTRTAPQPRTNVTITVMGMWRGRRLDQRLASAAPTTRTVKAYLTRVSTVPYFVGPCPRSRLRVQMDPNACTSLL